MYIPYIKEALVIIGLLILVNTRTYTTISTTLGVAYCITVIDNCVVTGINSCEETHERVCSVIYRSGSVHGTATAASIWNTGAVGAAVAFHRYKIAIVLAVISFIILVIAPPI